MSVITTIVTKYCTVHATDSLLSRVHPDGTVEHIEWQQSKIIPVPRWRGAMLYWGLAEHELYNWSTHRWLKNQVQCISKVASPKDFAKQLRDNLNDEISRMKFNNPRDAGIGVQLSVYEYIEECWIPELFFISNWTDPTYSTVSQELCLTRETFHQMTDAKYRDENGDLHLRLAVYKFLQYDNFLIFNNGDPLMFNVAANTILGLFRIAAQRHKLKDMNSIDLWLSIARRPIEIVSEAQHDFYRKNARIVGGKPHDLAIEPNGKYTSTTGDK